MKRRDAREAAFLLIFEKGFHTEEMGEVIELATQGREVELDGYAHRLATLAGQDFATLDQKFVPYLDSWKLHRLPRVTLSVLRLAVCELDNFPDIPVRVSINEAIELAKKYGTEEDAAYVNGVLGSYVKTAQLQKDASAGDDSVPCEEH